jgi:UPF0755 protein
LSTIVKVVVGLAFAALVALAAAYFHVQRELDTPVTVPEDGLVFTIKPGAAFGPVANQLEADGVISSAFAMRLLARGTNMASRVQAGEYLVEPGATPRSLLEQFTSGNVRLYSFTIVEGWNHWELLAALHADDNIVATMEAEDWGGLLEELGAERDHPEGLFLPETYRFPATTTDRDVLRQAYELMQATLAEEWPERAPDAPVETPYDALVLASIVEKETARADERERIAGVFARRLEKGMRLQTDPTVIYGIGPEFNGNLTRRDLRTDTPYNTYRRHGLPPTPIAMPGRAAIRAALNPADGSELYFVATGLGDGSHKFSETKDEHDAAVREYLQRLRNNRR